MLTRCVIYVILNEYQLTTGEIMVRQFTNQLLEMIEDSMLESETVLLACLKYMSEDDVKDMMHRNEFLLSEEE